MFNENAVGDSSVLATAKFKIDSRYHSIRCKTKDEQSLILLVNRPIKSELP